MWTSQGWELTLRRLFYDWEIARLTDLYNKLEAFKGIQEGVDSLGWQRHNRGVYQVKAAYKILNQRLQKFFLVGKKLELKQLTEIDGGLFQHASGGQFGKKGMLDVLKTEATQCRRSNSIAPFDSSNALRLHGLGRFPLPFVSMVAIRGGAVSSLVASARLHEGISSPQTWDEGLSSLRSWDKGLSSPRIWAASRSCSRPIPWGKVGEKEEEQRSGWLDREVRRRGNGLFAAKVFHVYKCVLSIVISGGRNANLFLANHFANNVLSDIVIWYSFRSITALKIYIQSGLDSLESSRESLLVKLFEIDKTMGNPRKEDIARVRYCPECYADADGVLCVHCELNDLFQVYEARLFRLNKGKRGEVITSAEEAVDLQKKKSALNRFYTTLARTDKNSGSATAEYEDFGKKRDLEDIMVSKAPSDLEVVLGLIKSNSRGLLDAEGVLAAKKQLQLLEGMRKEYAQARLLSTAQAHVLRAHDEIMMATSRLRLKEDENDKSIDALDQGELDAASAEWSSEKFFFLSSLSRTKGQLRYLKGLVQSKQNNHCASSENSTIAQATMDSAAHAEEKTEHQARTEERTCPVCQEKLNNQKMVFQCGHVICCKCKFLITWYPSFQLQVTVIVNVLFYITYLYLL
uniref:Uncharacterized protein n=1 Tax=Nicotiana tabacum TaxID=4097 RepID=A0A1S3ZHJ9_TOBAC|nr:PREDICTED: uncharacterized protein LOC107786861 [Nicotiana tabacum]